MITATVLENEIFQTDTYLNKCLEMREESKKDYSIRFWDDEIVRVKIELETLRYLYSRYFDRNMEVDKK